MIKTSLIIVTYNSGLTIDKCLKNLGKPGVETFVVDNKSSDDTVEKVKKYSQVKLIENKSNLGFAAANNVALSKVTSVFVFLLNPDVQLVDDVLEKMVKFMEKNPDVGGVGPKLLNTKGSIQKEISPFPTLISEILVLLRLHRIPPFKNVVYPDYDYEKTQKVEHLMGSALLIRKNVLDIVGLFDENFFLWFEETDLLKRIKDAGYKIVYYPKAEVVHLVGQSTKQLNPILRQKIWNRSLRYYFKKHKSVLERIILEPFMAFSYITPLLQLFLGKIKGVRFINSL